MKTILLCSDKTESATQLLMTYLISNYVSGQYGAKQSSARRNGLTSVHGGNLNKITLYGKINVYYLVYLNLSTYFTVFQLWQM